MKGHAVHTETVGGVHSVSWKLGRLLADVISSQVSTALQASLLESWAGFAHPPEMPFLTFWMVPVLRTPAMGAVTLALFLLTQIHGQLSPGRADSCALLITKSPR